MRGHEAIIAMRKAGRRPAIVFLNDFPCDTDWQKWGDHVTVDVSGEQPEWADLRFLVGLRVSITSKSEKRAKRLFEACKRAGCATVAAGSPAFYEGRWNPAWSDVWHAEQVEVV
jgi:hypothetical protein